MTRLNERPRIASDPKLDGRWLVHFRGHTYPFPHWPAAVKASLDPQHLCKYACICPVLDRRAS